jgi:hypothetical protein
MASLIVEILARAEDDGSRDKITIQCIGKRQQEPGEKEPGTGGKARQGPNEAGATGSEMVVVGSKE